MDGDVHDAAYDNDVEELRALLDGDPGLVEAEGESSWRPLHYACQGGALEAAVLLLGRGGGIDVRNADGRTPLMEACYQGRAEVVSLLLARGADPTLRDAWLSTTLMRAALGYERPGSDYVAVTRLLLADGRVPVDARDWEGETALFQACRGMKTQVARMLLVEARADYTIETDFGWTAGAIVRHHRQKTEECEQLLQVRER